MPATIPVLSKRGASFFDVEVQASIVQAEQLEGEVAQERLPLAPFPQAGGGNQ